MSIPGKRKWLGASPVKRSIMLVLGLLVALFVLGMWLLSSLNLDFAEETISDLRQRQIADSFYGNLDRIDAHHHLMEQNTNDLARLAQLLYWQSRQAGQNNTAQLESSLTETLEDFPDTFGGGLWFEPDTLVAGPYALYAYRTGADMVLERDMTGGYLEREDYLRLVPADTQDDPQRRYHWTPAYYKAGIDTVVVSLSTPIRNRDGEIIGIASTDWRAEDIIRLVSRVEVTPGSFSFLLDSESRNLSSLSEADDVQHAQRLMQAISGAELQQRATPQAPDEIVSNRQLGSPMQTMTLTVDGASYQLFFARTVAGLVFGIGVPQAEIDAVLTPMRDSNLHVALIIGAVFAVLATLIMLLVASILRQLSTLYTDSLTGLPNREKLLVELRKTDSAALLLLNIDAFKQINDFYGHECGDHVIRQLAEHMQRFIQTRAAWRSCELYSMPADEMAIIMPGHHTPASLPARLDEMVNFVSLMRITWQDHDIPVHASIGAASTVQPDNSRLNGEALLPSASIALKLARLNQSSYFVYDPANRVRETYEQNLIWANALKTALDEGRIVPFFQPIMDIRTGRISKFECLARMLDRKGQPVSPEQFLSIAKKIRLYRYITRTMVDQCFRRFANSRYEFSLNLSCEDLLDADLTEFIFDRLQGNDLAQRVIFEILESEGIENYEPVREFIDRAKALNCRIAIDDFGTGYSNFEHLLRLNIDIIKIDGSLIRHLDANDDAMTLTRGIVRFASELGIHTVAEFVHSPEVLEQVRELGIDFAQGAYVGMPAGALITEVELA